ncbi:HAD superfamily hydrolase (TIGR01509 family) [Dysgonomonadaceae bacterium PH5-43]|nr:HAD superfamily hydrolase (TIGR01509 family) [Dysgonomonadaceae bacterium PH5-43]
MIDLNNVKGVIFDYGATIDSNGKHWAEVLWDAYVDNNIPVTKEAFRDAYVYGERYLALHPVVKPDFTFKDVLEAKTKLQVEWLIENKFLTQSDKTSQYSLVVSNQCYNFVRFVLENAIPIIQELKQKYPLVLVSNFYGNIETVLADFGLSSYFDKIIESAVVNVRKPDPAIFDLGIKALNLRPEEVVVVGDSYAKDIVPARTIGCKTVWLKGPAWEDDKPNSTADAIIYDFKELREIFKLS